MDDSILISRVLMDGDQRAFGVLVNRYQSKLRYSLRQLTGGDFAIADDLAQETFIQAYKHLSSYRGDAGFFTWLYRIAYRQFASYHRARKPVESLDNKQMEDQSHNEERDSQIQRDIARAMSQLPHEQAMALHLHLHREYTHSEIADIMECPLGTVKSHILRGREKLKVLLSEWQ